MKRKFNQCGQQFHQHQQNKQLPLTFTELNEQKKKTMIYDARNPGLGLGQSQKFGRG